MVYVLVPVQMVDILDRVLDIMVSLLMLSLVL